MQMDPIDSIVDDLQEQISEFFDELYRGFVIIEIIDKIPIVVHFDKNFSDMIGYSISELQGKDASNYTSEEFLLKASESWKKNDQIPYKFQINNKEGAKVSIEVITKYINQNDRIFIFFRIKEISELRLKEDLMEEIVSRSPNFIQIVDQEGNIKFFNKATEDHTIEEFLKLKAIDFIQKDYINNFMDTIQKVYQTGKSQIIRTIDTYGRHYYAFFKPILLNNKMDKIILYSIDITDLEQANTKIEGERHYYEQLLTQFPDAIIVSDKHGRVIEWMGGSEKIFGFTNKEMMNQKISILNPDDLRDEYSQRIAKALNRDGEFSGELQCITKTGNKILIHMDSKQLLNIEGDKIGLIGILRDITDIKKEEERQRELQSKLQHQQKLESLGLLAGGIAHDFNNLLLGIMANTSLILEHMNNDNEVRPLVEEIIKITDQASGLSNQMLTYVGKGTFRIENIDMNQKIKNLSSFLHSSNPGVSISYELQENVPAINIDVSHINQILINLTSNAAEAMNHKGNILIKTSIAYILDDTEERRKYVCLEVIDYGKGMTSETKKHIFDPFFTTKFTGRGLGLSVVHGIIKSLNGFIEIESAVDKGSTFRILIPVIPNELVYQSDNIPDIITDQKGLSGTILICDDEELVRSILCKMLSKMGLSHIEARNGRDCLNKYQEYGEVIDLVLLDLTMPDLSGVEVLKELHKENPTLPVILSSGYSAEEVSSYTVNEHVDFLQKPYQYDDLKNIVVKVLGK